MGKVIRYHGTSKSNSESIIQSKFKEGTWFSENLQDAIGYGGPYIFEVAFEENDVKDKWQFHILESIPSDRIITFYSISTKVFLDRPELRRDVFSSNMEEASKDDIESYITRDLILD